jgi:chromosome segregation ATPase|tara:strand:+ start:2039 stop:2641 length:603 start_codon:yes stop_codon:yes gene_type:complete
MLIICILIITLFIYLSFSRVETFAKGSNVNKIVAKREKLVEEGEEALKEKEINYEERLATLDQKESSYQSKENVLDAKNENNQRISKEQADVTSDLAASEMNEVQLRQTVQSYKQKIYELNKDNKNLKQESANKKKTYTENINNILNPLQKQIEFGQSTVRDTVKSIQLQNENIKAEVKNWKGISNNLVEVIDSAKTKFS